MKGIVPLLLIGGGVWVAYELGLFAGFGFSPSPAAAAPPTPTGPGGIVPATSAPGTTTVTVSSPAPTPAGPSTTPTPAPAPVATKIKTPLTVAQLTQWAGFLPVAPGGLPQKLQGYNWNALVTEHIPGAQVSPMPGVGTGMWTAAQYLAERQKFGLSGAVNYRRRVAHN